MAGIGGIIQMKGFARVIFSRRIAVVPLLGFSAGLPFRLTADTLQVWMQDEGRSLALIGLFSLVGLPYALKFLWAPIFDCFAPPVLGRRRGWIVMTQAFVFASILILALAGQSGSLPWICAAAVLLSFAGASQDIVLDAHRRDTLKDEELGFGASLFVTGYRIAMLVSGPLAMLLSISLSWPAVYVLMSAFMIIGVSSAFLAPEPPAVAPVGFAEAVKAPITGFVRCWGVKKSATLLVFVVLYKLGDAMAAAMTVPFILEMGFSKAQLVLSAETLGLFAVVGGGILGGVLIFRMGINKSLLVFGLLQAVSTAGFLLLIGGGSSAALAAVIILEKAATGMGASAFVAFLMRLTDRRFSAAQYALLTSIMGIGPKILSAQAGFLAAYLGWSGFFITCTLAALPGLLLIPVIAPWRETTDHQQHETVPA